MDKLQEKSSYTYTELLNTSVFMQRMCDTRRPGDNCVHKFKRDLITYTDCLVKQNQSAENPTPCEKQKRDFEKSRDKCFQELRK